MSQKEDREGPTLADRDLVNAFGLAESLERVAYALRRGHLRGCSVEWTEGSDPKVAIYPLEPVQFVTFELTAPKED